MARPLKRHFWRAGYVESLLHWLGHGDGAPKRPNSRAEIEAQLQAQADAPLAGRTREEIIARAMDRAAEAANLHLDSKIADAIAELLDISGPAEEALAKIRATFSRPSASISIRNWRPWRRGWRRSNPWASIFRAFSSLPISAATWNITPALFSSFGRATRKARCSRGRRPL
jgi:hypothetical protein